MVLHFSSCFVGWLIVWMDGCCFCLFFVCVCVCVVVFCVLCVDLKKKLFLINKTNELILITI